MKVSLDWIRFINAKYGSAPEPAPDGIDNLVEKIGAQLGAVDQVRDLTRLYKDIKIVKVVSCTKHPNADKLSACLVDDGGVNNHVKRNEKGLIQIVCGAPNVKEGMLAVWIPPGVQVPSTIDKEPFTIGAVKIRNVMSSGMLASAKELALGDNHEGLLVIDKGKPGDDFAKTFGLNDYIIDIENKMFTHRPDLFGHLGIAREIAGISGQPFKSPSWYRVDAKISEPETKSLQLSVDNKITALVPRFCAVAIENVKVGPSPTWLVTRLARLDIKPINNIVDLTNLLTYETAQPLHAYDYDKLKTGTLGVRLSGEDEKLRLLGGKEIKLAKGDIIITDGKEPVGLGGVMGGQDTEVDKNTRNIVLESANFNMNSIRRTSMTHGLFTDAATRFTKNQSPLQTMAVLAKLSSNILKIAGGNIASEVVDYYDNLPKQPTIKLSEDFINSRLGLELGTDRIKKILTDVEFDLNTKDRDLLVTPPFWRTDIHIPEDVVEEVGRLMGYDSLPMKLPLRDLVPTETNQALDFKKQVRNILARGGANELLTYSFVHSSLLTNAGQKTEDAFKLRNALSPDLQYYRLSLTPSLLDRVHPNIKAGYKSLALFEINKTHDKLHQDKSKDSSAREHELLALVVASVDKAVIKNRGSAFYKAKAYLDFLAQQLGLELSYEAMSKESGDPMLQPYDHERSAVVKELGSNGAIGVIGEFKESVISRFKLPLYCAGFEVNYPQLLKAYLSKYSTYKPLSRYPKIEQDISLQLKSSTNYGNLFDFAMKELNKLKPKDTFINLIPLDIYQQADDSETKNVAFRLTITASDRTLIATEVNNLLDQLAEKAKIKFKAKRL